MHASGSGEVHGSIELPLAETPDAFVWESGEPLLLEDLTAESRWPRVIGPMKDEGIQSCCFVPLRAGERNLGSLIVASGRQGTYRKEDIEGLQQVGQQVAVAVDHALNGDSAWRSKQEADRQREQAFPESDVEFLTQVAGQITLAMENALAHQEITHLKTNWPKKSYISRRKFAPNGGLKKSSATARP